MQKIRDLFKYEMLECEECGSRGILAIYPNHTKECLYHQFICLRCLEELKSELKRQEAIDEEMGDKDENPALTLEERNKPW